jgi:NAD(P)-dependent dehydrogenase (short-subunit alcohol dehydrogenase family)
MALDYRSAGIPGQRRLPGLHRTRTVQEPIDRHGDQRAAEESMVRCVALGRIADPAEIAAAIASLPKAVDFTRAGGGLATPIG